MPSKFDHHIGIDYSGAGTPMKRTPSIQVYASHRDQEVSLVASPASTASRPRNWNRIEVCQWITSTLENATQRGETCIVGMDHGFSFPLSYFDRYELKAWDDFLRDFAKHWPTDREDVTVESLRSNSQRVGTNDELRLTERWTSSAKSVFQFDVNGSVAKSIHAGLPLLLQLRKKFKKQLHCWPFDGWKIGSGKHVVAEIYPSLFRNRYPREDRTVDQQDAYSVSRWLSEMDQSGSLEKFFHPPLNAEQAIRAKKEGWILGVV